MAFSLTTRPALTYLLPIKYERQTIIAIFLSVILALLLIPTTLAVSQMLQALYPMSSEVQEKLAGFMNTTDSISIPLLLLLLGVLPAVCEELTFRGFILSGLRHWGSRRRAIILTAIFFGVIHGMVHQSINATFLGVILGYIAVRTNSIWPCMAYHATNNIAALLMGLYSKGEFGSQPWLDWMLRESLEPTKQDMPQFQMYIIVIGILAAGVILSWFGRLPLEKTKEEAVWDQINENSKLELT